MKSNNSISAILNSLAQKLQESETSLVVNLAPSLIPDAMTVLRDYKKLFAPVIPGLTDTAPIYSAYEQLRQEDKAGHALLLLVQCKTLAKFRDAIGEMPIRHSSEWRSNGII